MNIGFHPSLSRDSFVYQHIKNHTKISSIGAPNHFTESIASG